MRRMIAHGIGPLEAVGLRPNTRRALAQCKTAVFGDRYAPPSLWGVSSLRIFRPLLGPGTWLGWSRRDRRVPIMNYFNHEAPPRGSAYDVRTTRVRDFRGGRLTYNSHVGTDLVVPVGTRVLAPAPGRVFRVENLMQRGGLKVAIDHGEGLITMSGHLSRALVADGDRVARGAPIGLSGFSAIDGMLFVPWVPPHVHLTVLLDGEPVDPFAPAGGAPLWRGGNEPGPARAEPGAPTPELDSFDDEAVRASIASCRDPALRRELLAIADPAERALRLVYWSLFSFGAFAVVPPLYAAHHKRRARLDLPFDKREVVGLAH